MEKNLFQFLSFRTSYLKARLQLLLIAVLFPCFSVSAQNGSHLFQLVTDINRTPTSSLTFNDYSQWTDVNGTLYFVLKNRQLWLVTPSDSTAVFLREFESINNLANINGALFFSANDGVSGTELWKTDGTPNGTTLVKDIRPGSTGSDPFRFTDVNGVVFFSAHDGYRGRELWKSDGTVAGTVIVKDIMRVVGSSNPSNLVSMNGLLFFVTNDGQRGYELWKSDGTASGTQIVKDIRPQYKVSSSPQELINVNGKLFFAALDNDKIRRLWISDGTAKGTRMVAYAGNGAEPGVAKSMNDPRRLTNVNGILYFVGRDAEHGSELWKSDGTAEGTQLVKDIEPGVRSPQYLHYLTSHNNYLYFVATSAYDLWISDGTEAGTIRLTEDAKIQLTGFPDLTPFKGMVYFLAQTDINTTHIFRIGKTSERVESFIHSTDGYYALTHLTASGNYLYYINQGALWRTDSVKKQAINGIFYNTDSSNPEHITLANGVMYFSAFDGMSYGLWKSDGSKKGTSLIYRFEADVTSLTVSGNYLYYWANSIDSDSLQLGLKLWRTDLTTDETTWVSDINKGGGDYLAELEDVGGTLFFSIEVPMIIGQEFPREAQLWKTTGTLSSTEYIKTFNEAGLPPTFLTHVNGTLFFSAVTDPNVGEELWKSDGTPEGTVMVKKINPNPLEPSAPSRLLNVNNTLFFSAYTGQYELWKSDGTEAGTVRVKDINPLGLVNLSDTLYFYSSNELWKSDGTEAGTIKVASFTAPEGARVYAIYILGKIKSDIIVGTSYASMTFLPGALWKTNGTKEGTEVLLNPIDNLTRFSNIIANDNIIYFTGPVNNTPDYDLWRTDGTTCGTFAVTTEGNPGNLVRLNDLLYLSLTHPKFGRELFLMDESQISNPCTTSIVYHNEGFEENDREKIVTSYPNPFISDFILNVAGNDKDTYDVRILDMNGEITGEYIDLLYNKDYTIGSNLFPGIYIVKVKGMRIVNKRIVKIR